jgi:phospholipase C
VRRSHVSSAIYDHASILKLLEWRWSLAPLSARDTFANNLGDELDFTLPLASAPTIEVPAGPYGGLCG